MPSFYESYTLGKSRGRTYDEEMKESKEKEEVGNKPIGKHKENNLLLQEGE